MKSVLLLVLITGCGNVYAQSPFEIKILSSKHKIMEVRYDGSLGSVADTDTIMLKPFKFLSIGRFKEASAVARESIYTLFSYRNNQTVIIESGDDNCCTPSDWKLIENLKSMPYYSILRRPVKDRDRSSFSKELKSCKVHILNIKDEEVDFFKWMVTTIESN